MTKYVIEALVILVLVFGALAAALLIALAHRRRTVPVWHSPAGLPAVPGRVVSGRARHPAMAGPCCLVVPCSADCARRQQSAHTAAYLTGMSDAHQHPNRVQQLVREGEQLGYRDDTTGPQERW